MTAISSLSGVSSPYTQPAGSLRQSLSQLSDALKSGDLSGAQSAFGSLSQIANGSGPFAQALQQIGNALQSGDLGQAQQAMTQLQQQMQAARGTHHHGHHADGNQASAGATQPSADTSVAPSASNSSNVVNITA